MKRVGFICPFVPGEWIAAHGLQPVRFMPETLDSSPGSRPAAGVCPFAQSLLASLEIRQDLDLIVMTSVCDQMRRTAESLALCQKVPVFFMHVPAAWKHPIAKETYLSELLRLGNTLVRLGGTAPTPQELWTVMRHTAEVRGQICSRREELSPRHFTETLIHFHENGQIPPGQPQDHPSRLGVPVALLGSHQTRSFLPLFDLIQHSGGYVALDATPSGERGLPGNFGNDDLDPLCSLANAYYETIPDAFKRPNDLLYSWLNKINPPRGVRGILLLHPTWCDLWAAEAVSIRNRTGLPVLSLDPGLDGNLDPRHTTRIEAFLEMLQ